MADGKSQKPDKSAKKFTPKVVDDLPKSNRGTGRSEEKDNTLEFVKDAAGKWCLIQECEDKYKAAMSAGAWRIRDGENGFEFAARAGCVYARYVG